MPEVRSLERWLDYIGSQHPQDMELGLDRVAAVARLLEADQPAPLVVTVAGTNGKGSTTMALEALLIDSGLTVGSTFSPHVSRFNERIRVNGIEASDEAICEAFARVDEVRGETPLTYFEFAALAALWCFRAAAVEVAVLEIGLGGRLDAFNLVDADVAVVTSIGLDHADYLGTDLEAIGREKAGIFRAGRDAVLGTVTNSVHEAARELGCRTFALGRDIRVDRREAVWDYACELLDGRFSDIPYGALAPDNCALALTAAMLVLEQLKEPRHIDTSVLAEARLPGRMECHTHAGRTIILDVAHNPAAARFLARELEQRWPNRRFTAIYGALSDKDASGVVAALNDRVDDWLLIPTRGWRGQSSEALAEKIRPGGPHQHLFEDVAMALEKAVSLTRPEDVILAFGSFSAVEQVRALLIVPPSAGP
jgi:dihydrofolate synthase/folylpolyglutamate synthase